MATAVRHTRRRRGRLAAPLAAAVVAVTAVVAGIVYALPASAAPGDSHWFVLNAASAASPRDVYQTSRRANGTFNTQVKISDQTGQALGRGFSISAVKVGVNLHLFAAGTEQGPIGRPLNGVLYYAMQNTSGAWPTWTKIHTQRESSISHVVATNVAGQLHVVITGPWRGENDATLLHSVKQSNGTFLPFGELTAHAGNPGADLSYRLAAAGTPNGLLHVFVTGRSERIQHTIRSANGSWSRWSDILGATGRPWRPVDNPDYGPEELEAAPSGDEVQLLFKNNGNIWHTIRRTDGTWFPFGDMSFHTGLARNDLTGLATAGFANNGNLVVAGKHARANDLRFTIRRANGSWDAWTSNPKVPTTLGAIYDMCVLGE